MEENKRHVSLAVSCPNSENHHANFRHDTEKGEFVCVSCGYDFTLEMHQVWDGLTKALKYEDSIK